MRAYWKGDGGLIGEFARRLTGSSDLYGRSGRLPHASINFITAHDGFTLHDLVSYNDKHNEANLEDNRDGNNHNLSWNCGVEGPTDDPAINALRGRQKRNLLATLLLSQGVPMLLAGDEIGRTQGGNNNAYCQDNATSWLDWNVDADRSRLLDFVRRLVHAAAQASGVPAAPFFSGAAAARRRGEGYRLAQARRRRDDPGRVGSGLRALPRRLSCRRRAGRDRCVAGTPVADANFVVLFNAHHDAVPFRLPEYRAGSGWPCSTPPSKTGLAAGRNVRRRQRLSVARPLAGAADPRWQRVMKRRHAMPFGAELSAGGGTRFRLWAPAARQIDLLARGARNAGAKRR